MKISVMAKTNISHIAIIGCGASAVLILESLRDTAFSIKKKLSITIFERDEKMARSMAYRSGSDRLILNTLPETMSVSERQPDDFVKWLRSRGIVGKEGIPRKIYGDYLEEKLSSCIAALQRDGHRVTVYNTSVEAVTINEKHSVIFAGQKMTFDVCILATGGELREPENIALSGAQKILSIFDEEPIANIKKGSKVAILGSGQSAIDACILMESFGIEGYYTLVSRRGILPRVKSERADHCMQLSEMIAEKKARRDLGEMHHLISSAIRWKSGDAITENIRPASFRSMELDLLRSSKSVPSWQRVMKSVTPYINASWLAFDESDRNRFLNNYYTGLYHLRSAIMPLSAQRFLAIYNSGRLEMSWGDYRLESAKNAFHLRKKDALLQFDYVINSSGISPSSFYKLVQSEVQTGNVGLSDMGGLRIDGETMQVLNSTGKPNRGFYSIGYPTQGSVLITNSIELLRHSASMLVTHLIRHF